MVPVSILLTFWYIKSGEAFCMFCNMPSEDSGHKTHQSDYTVDNPKD